MNGCLKDYLKSIFGVLTSMFKYHGTDPTLCTWLWILLDDTNSNEWGRYERARSLFESHQFQFPEEVFLFHLNKDDYSYFSAESPQLAETPVG